MYDGNQLYDELFQTLKSGTQTMQNIMAYLEKNKGTPQQLLDNDFVFTGQSTDLRYFQTSDTMSVKMIQNIQDENLKSAVKDEFNKAILDGKLTLDTQTGIITITQKGKEFIQKPEFQRAAALDLQSVIQQQTQTLGVELDGTIQDLGFFQFSDKLDLKEVMQSGNADTVRKILENFHTLEQNGIIGIRDMTVSLTDKGEQFLNLAAQKGIFANTTEKALSALPVAGIAGKVFVVTKKVLEQTAKAIGNTARQ